MSKNQSQQESNKKHKEADKSKQVQSYLKYSGMAFQMGIIILVGALIGRQIDAYFELEKPLGTASMSLLAIFAALYLTLKDLLK